MKIVNHTQGTKEWLEWRKGGCSASEAAIIIGQSKYTTPYQLWAEKVGLMEPEDLSNNPHVKRGNENEDNVRKLFEKLHPGEICLPLCAEHDSLPFMRASFDGVLSDNSPTEFKCPAESTFKEVREKQRESAAFKLYEIQVQHQMIVAEAEKGYLLFWRSDDEYELFEITARPDFQKQLIDACEAFNKLIEKRTPPEKDPARDVYVPKNDIAKKAWAQTAVDVRTVQSELDELKAKEKKLKEKLKPHKAKLESMMEGFTTADYCGIRVNNVMRQGSVDWEKIVKEKLSLSDDELESYRKKGSKSFSIKVTDNELEKRSLDVDEAQKAESMKKTIANDDLFF